MSEESTATDLAEVARAAVEALNVDLGGGVVLAVNDQRGRLAGSTAEVRLRDAWVYECADAVIARLTMYLDVEEARAAAERLAEERG
jgi:hypothetical protein